MIEYRCSKPIAKKASPVGSARKDGKKTMKRKNNYNEVGIENIKKLMLLLRGRSGNLTKMEVESDGLKRAVKKLPSDSKMAVEKFFLKKENLYEKYCVILGPKDEEILAWKGGHPPHIEGMAKTAFEAISLLQRPRSVMLYDEKFRKICKDLLKEGKENEEILWIEIYLTFFKSGAFFFFDKEGEIVDKEREKDIAVDGVSIISKYAKKVMLKRKRPLRLEIVKDWFTNALTQEQQKELLLAIGEKPPRNLGVGTPNKLLTFAEAREIKLKLFPKGPWRTAERLVEGYYEPLTGLAALRGKDNYDWMRTTEAYASAGYEAFPDGKRLQKYKISEVKNSFEFFDLEEVLWLNRWGPNK